MSKFEKILEYYGAYVFACVYKYALENEKYEDCAEMKHIADKYDIPFDFSVQDWIESFWSFGLSGKAAWNNKNYYIGEAMKLAGY